MTQKTAARELQSNHTAVILAQAHDRIKQVGAAEGISDCAGGFGDDSTCDGASEAA